MNAELWDLSGIADTCRNVLTVHRRGFVPFALFVSLRVRFLGCAF